MSDKLQYTIDESLISDDDILSAAINAFQETSEEFDSVKESKWYKNIFKAVSIKYGSKKFIIKRIENINELQTLLMQLYVNTNIATNQEIKRIIELAKKQNEKIKDLYFKTYYRFESQMNLDESLSVSDQELLLGLLSEIANSSSKYITDVVSFNETIADALSAQTPNTSEVSGERIKKAKDSKTIYRCLIELSSITDDDNIQKAISGKIKYLPISEDDKEEIKDLVERESKAFGPNHLINKYKRQSIEPDLDLWEEEPYTSSPEEAYDINSEETFEENDSVRSIILNYTENEQLGKRLFSTVKDEDKAVRTNRFRIPVPGVFSETVSHIVKKKAEDQLIAQKAIVNPRSQVIKTVLVTEDKSSDGLLLDTHAVIEIVKINNTKLIFTNKAVYINNGKTIQSLDYQDVNEDNLRTDLHTHELFVDVNNGISISENKLNESLLAELLLELSKMDTSHNNDRFATISDFLYYEAHIILFKCCAGLLKSLNYDLYELFRFYQDFETEYYILSKKQSQDENDLVALFTNLLGPVNVYQSSKTQTDEESEEISVENDRWLEICKTTDDESDFYINELATMAYPNNQMLLVRLAFLITMLIQYTSGTSAIKISEKNIIRNIVDRTGLDDKDAILESIIALSQIEYRLLTNEKIRTNELKEYACQFEGQTNDYNSDYNEIFLPINTFESIKLLLVPPDSLKFNETMQKIADKVNKLIIPIMNLTDAIKAYSIEKIIRSYDEAIKICNIKGYGRNIERSLVEARRRIIQLYSESTREKDDSKNKIKDVANDTKSVLNKGFKSIKSGWDETKKTFNGKKK